MYDCEWKSEWEREDEKAKKSEKRKTQKLSTNEFIESFFGYIWVSVSVCVCVRQFFFVTKTIVMSNIAYSQLSIHILKLQAIQRIEEMQQQSTAIGLCVCVFRLMF